MEAIKNFLFGAKNSKYNRRLTNGDELLDDTPVALPLDHEVPESIEDKIKRLIQSERFAQAAAARGFETFEEADDFEIGDDFEAEPHSPWELSADQESFKSDPPKRKSAPKAQETQPKAENKPVPRDEVISTEKIDQ